MSGSPPVCTSLRADGFFVCTVHGKVFPQTGKQKEEDDKMKTGKKQKNTLKPFLVAVMAALMLVGLAACGNKTPSDQQQPPQQTPALSGEITIAAAASLKESLAEIQQLYNKAQPGVTLTFTFGSSGSLQQQIEQGAPVDIFISAGQKQMTALVEKDLMITDTVSNLLENSLVLIANKNKPDIKGFDDLATDKVTKLAMGEPGSVPAGQYGQEVLTNLAILDKVKDKLVYGKDVKEVLAWVTTGDADAGLVYATDAKVAGDSVTLAAYAPEGSTHPSFIRSESSPIPKTGSLHRRLWISCPLPTQRPPLKNSDLLLGKGSRSFKWTILPFYRLPYH